MVALNHQTVAGALDGLAKKQFSSKELTEAHIAQMEKHRDLNAYITETPEKALAMAVESDARRAKGEAPGLMEGLPIGMKDLFCTEGVLTTAGSHILDGFHPTYESTVSANLWKAGAVMLGKLNMDEFAMGSSNGTSYYGPVTNPWRRRGENTRLVPGGSSGGSAAAVAARMALAATGTDTGGSIRQPAAFAGLVGLKPTYGRCSRWGIVAFASSLDQAGPMCRTVEDTAIMMTAMAGYDPKDSTSVDMPVPDFRKIVEAGVKGLKIGIPKEYRIDGMSPEIAKLWDQGAAWLKEAGAEIREISLPHTKYALPVYYIIAPAEASSNLARYDGVRFGLRVPGSSLDDMYELTRAAGFGKEVKRRIMIGTYVLSAGYYDAYYLRAQRIRALILKDFTEAFKQVDVILTPSTPSAAFGLEEKFDDPVAMYLNDVFTVTVNLAGLPGISVPAGLDSRGLPLGLQLIGRAFDEETVLKAGRAIERAANFTAMPEGFKMVAEIAIDEKNLIEGKTGKWEVVLGLEVHAQVISKSKLFSGAATEFGAEPNTQVSLVDAGFPGMLPVINEHCVEQAVLTGLGLNAEINLHSVFDRKNYFYADLPQGYQISQYLQPIVGKGTIILDLPEGKRREVGITRLHLEQDAGKSLHDQSPTKTYIDLNRSGVALMEIVSEPDMRNSEEAAAYLRKLRSILRYLGTCDGNMDEGSMRCDVNVSVRKPGGELGTRNEIKNVNSIRFVAAAIEYEARRQIEVLEEGGTIKQETRLWDTNKGITRSMRSKEQAHDYRYFPDPDLLPLNLDSAWVEKLRASLPELPDPKRARFTKEFGLSDYDAGVLVAEQETAAYYELAAKGRDAKLTANWLISELFGLLNKSGKSITESPVSAAHLGELVGLIQDNTISGRIAKDVFAEMFETGSAPGAIVEAKGLKQVTDTGAIDAAIDDILAKNADKVAEYKSGKDKLFGFFVGQTMKATGGKANPAMLNERLKAKLNG